ncbi:MAG: CRISPR-associated protein Cas4 [Patescibacteria group bacterium]|nr:CRISPR-associated protein Cas4 [Patescibacteria group bacterium]
MENSFVIFIILTFSITLSAAYFLIRYSKRLQKKIGFDYKQVVYQDIKEDGTLTRPLFARQYGLVGKPDFIIEENGHLIPVEYKPTSQEIYSSHIGQLMAYCFLVEEIYGLKPPYGKLQLKDHVEQIEYSESAREEVIRILQHIREDLEKENVLPNHQEKTRCLSCMRQEICGESKLD